MKLMKCKWLAMALTLLTMPTYAASPPQTGSLNTPSNGWNYAGLTDQSAKQSVTYPTPPIDRGSQKNRALIKGKIQHASRARMPKLVANGNPVFLNTDKDGNFSRYYAMGSGSNSVEIKSHNGQSIQRVQYYEANPNQLTPQLRIICSWDAPEAEVDLHVLTPDGEHAYFGSPILNSGGGLDVDSVDGPGPEIFSTISPQHGVYHLYVNYWGNLTDAGYTFEQSVLEKPIITARITLVYYENTPKEKRESFVIPLRKIGDLNLVKSFRF